MSSSQADKSEGAEIRHARGNHQVKGYNIKLEKPSLSDSVPMRQALKALKKEYGSPAGPSYLRSAQYSVKMRARTGMPGFGPGQRGVATGKYPGDSSVWRWTWYHDYRRLPVKWITADAGFRGVMNPQVGYGEDIIAVSILP
jgi:hypothetical protein